MYDVCIEVPCVTWFHNRTLTVAPLLAPLSFGRDVVDSGDFAQLSCIAMKGDEPLSVSWTFHGATGDPGILTSPIGNSHVWN